MRVDSSGIDAAPEPDAFVPATSLEGPVSCGSAQCGSGTLCTHWSSGIDAGVPGDNIGCSIVPAKCAVRDCGEYTYYGCPQCIWELCTSTYSSAGVYLTGRDLYCPGV